MTFANLEEGIQQAVYGDIKKQLEVKKARGLTFATTTLVEFGTSLQLSWYNMPYLRNTLKPGSNYIFRGLVQRRRGRLVMDHPQLYKPEEYESRIFVLQPVYSLTRGVSNKTIAKAVKQALEKLDLSREYLPEEIRSRRKLPEYNFAIQAIHFPTEEESLRLARKRLVFDEFFFFIDRKSVV